MFKVRIDVYVPIVFLMEHTRSIARLEKQAQNKLYDTSQFGNTLVVGVQFVEKSE